MATPIDNNAYYRELHQQLVRELDRMDDTHDTDALTSFRKKIQLIYLSITHLKEKVLTTPFSKPEEEIHFMKKLLPDLLSMIIYYSEKVDLECIRVITNEKLRLEFINRKLNRVELFFLDNAEFIRYYHSGNDNVDEYYFLRAHAGKHQPALSFSEWPDPRFFTIFTLHVATLLAYSKLEEDIHQMKMNHPSVSHFSIRHRTPLEWTDSKSGLVELIYCLKERGAFNNGKADIKTISEHFAKIFSIDLGNTSSAFQKIIFRKTNRTRYLDDLKNSLLARIEQIETDQMK